MCRPFAATIVALACMASITTIAAELPTVAGGFQVPVTSLRQAQLRSTLLQQFDFSCGSAALATLLTHQYGHPTSEADIFDAMFRDGDRTLIRQQGFSLLDMKRYLARLGYAADGFEQPLERLVQARLPAIVLINEKGYNHFVVVKGYRNGRVLVGDPASGTRAMTRGSFEAAWTSGLLFVIHSHAGLARFDDPVDWMAAPGAPVSTVGSEQLRTVILPRLGTGEF